MSKMADLDLQIQDMLDEGLRPVTVAGLLQVPLAMVYDVIENALADEPELAMEMMSYDEEIMNDDSNYYGA